MLVTTIDLVELDPGEFLRWQSLPSSEGVLSDIPPSANQRFHLAPLLRAGAKRVTGWLAVTFDVPGKIRPDLLAAAFKDLIARHESLRCSFEAVDGAIRRLVHPVRAAALIEPTEAVWAGSPEEVRALLAESLDEACDPARFPSGLFAAIDRPESSTVICGFDHTAVDTASLALIVREVRNNYLARIADQDPPKLPPVGSFLDYCAHETSQPPLPQGHPGLAIWREFLASQNGSFPSFPLDLGVAQGDLAPQATSVFPLLGQADADVFEDRCKQDGGSLFSGELTALARATRALGGPGSVPMLVPLHTRLRPEWEEAVGWFVTNIPLVFSCGDDFADGLRKNRAAFRAALPATKVAIGQVLSGQAGPFTFSRKDVSMVSHVDYRKVFGDAHDPELRATHISNTTVADDAQFWFSRTTDGLWLRVRHPGTARARDAVARLREQLVAILSQQVLPE